MREAAISVSRSARCAPNTARNAMLYGHFTPIAGRTDSRGAAPKPEKRTLVGTAGREAYDFWVTPPGHSR